jgi:hypothetical protein
MSKDGIRVEEFNIYSLGAEAVSYHLKDIHTLALQVTEKNIGILCLELETELIYTADGAPYLNVYVARGSKENPENDRGLIVRPTDWLVILWDEIHLFRDPEFRSTFSFDGLSSPAEKELRDYAEQDVKQTENLFVPMVEKDTGQKVLMRPGVYEQLADEAKSVFLPSPGPRTKPIEEGPTEDQERTQIMPSYGDVLEMEQTQGTPEIPQGNLDIKHD